MFDCPESPLCCVFKLYNIICVFMVSLGWGFFCFIIFLRFVLYVFRWVWLKGFAVSLFFFVFDPWWRHLCLVLEL